MVIVIFFSILFYPNWAAKASAIPGYVFDLFLLLSSDGLIFHIRFSLPSTIFVGSIGGSPLSHNHVSFVSPCPNCQGCITCDLGPIHLCIIVLGCSSTTLSHTLQASFQLDLHKKTPSHLKGLLWYHLFPQRAV